MPSVHPACHIPDLLFVVRWARPRTLIYYLTYLHLVKHTVYRLFYSTAESYPDFRLAWARLSRLTFLF